MRPAKEVIDALRFLTRLTLPAVSEPTGHPHLRFGAAAFPLVGALLGVVAAGVDVGAAAVPQGLRNVGILALWAAATGGLHYDGLADVLDALGGRDVEDRLRIMRDGTVGTFAVLGLVLVVAAELCALSLLHGSARLHALVAAPILGRWAMLLTAFSAPSARSEGLGREFVRRLSGAEVLLATATTGIGLVLLYGAPVPSVWLLVALAAGGVRLLAGGRFGGVTGDVLGASGKIGEALALAWFAAT
jgi:adenosylcobinamide-GDP ribazoletransferase